MTGDFPSEDTRIGGLREGGARDTGGRPSTRLHVDADLAPGAVVEAGEGQAHYLGGVLRAKSGDAVALFNGRDGEWLAMIADIGKRRVSFRLDRCLRPQDSERPSDLWLVFAPVKKQGTDMIVEKATELGVSLIQPVLTRFTNAARVNTDRLLANAVEASEQCERLSVPEVREPLPLDRLLNGWDRARRLFVLDETGAGTPAGEVFSQAVSGPSALLTGPEGGFAKGELDLLRSAPFVTAIGLGPRILRAETAAIAGLVCWQALRGDWRFAGA